MFKAEFKILVFLLAFSFVIKGQVNLVSNPSFEQYSQCPNNISGIGDDQVSKAIGWETYGETPDYFNSCGTIWNVDIPNNQPGYQWPHTGNAYCGLITYYIAQEFRETIGSQLSSPLIIGQKYYVSFYVSLAGKQGSCMATNNIGLKFSTQNFSYANPMAISNSADVYSNAIITDTTNWTLVYGSFIADSAYGYIALSNFFEDNNTDTLSIDDNPFSGYYFVDDICVTTDSNYALTWTGVDEVTEIKRVKIFPNPANDYLIIVPQYANVYTVSIFDSSGRMLFSEDSKNQNVIDISSYAEGVYYIKLIQESTVITNSIIVIH